MQIPQLACRQRVQHVCRPTVVSAVQSQPADTCSSASSSAAPRWMQKSHKLCSHAMCTHSCLPEAQTTLAQVRPWQAAMMAPTGFQHASSASWPPPGVATVPLTGRFCLLHATESLSLVAPAADSVWYRPTLMRLSPWPPAMGGPMGPPAEALERPSPSMRPFIMPGPYGGSPGRIMPPMPHACAAKRSEPTTLSCTQAACKLFAHCTHTLA